MQHDTADAQFYLLTAFDHLFWRGRPSASPRFVRKEALATRARTRDGYLEPRPPTPLPELPAHATRQELLDATQGYRRPVVVRGFATDTTAVERWSEAHLGEALGDVRCQVFVQDEASRQRSWDEGTRLEEMRFADYLGRRLVEPLYLNNSTELFQARPELLDDLDLPRIRARFHTPDSRWDELVTTNLFVGARHVYSAVHCAYAGNFFLEVSGRKRWVFLDPRLGPHLHATPGRPFQYLKSAYAGSRAAAERSDASVIACLPREEVVLEPGDLLYNPPWWWHEVDNLDDFTVGVALRHIPPPTHGAPSWNNHKVWSSLSTWPAARAAVWAHWAASHVWPGIPSARTIYGERQAAALRKGLGR